MDTGGPLEQVAGVRVGQRHGVVHLLVHDDTWHDVGVLVDIPVLLGTLGPNLSQELGP